jgi:hypothetical protein
MRFAVGEEVGEEMIFFYFFDQQKKRKEKNFSQHLLLR